MSSDRPFARLQVLAMNLLARREHSYKELRQKLIQKSGDQSLIPLIDEALADLQARNLLHDGRFAEAVLGARIGQGKGPVLVAAELKEKGISQEIIDELISETDVFWSELVKDVRKKRFGPELPLDFKDRARQMRFLQSRGFTLNHIQAALGN